MTTTVTDATDHLRNMLATLPGLVPAMGALAATRTVALAIEPMIAGQVANPDSLPHWIKWAAEEPDAPWLKDIGLPVDDMLGAGRAIVDLALGREYPARPPEERWQWHRTTVDRLPVARAVACADVPAPSRHVGGCGPGWGRTCWSGNRYERSFAPALQPISTAPATLPPSLGAAVIVRTWINWRVWWA